MNRKLKIVKNSFFLTFQPLFLQFISLFVVGYLARKLGKADFGIFNFVTNFTMIFYPLAMMGFDRVTVRDLSKLEYKESYIGKMVTLRAITTVLVIVIILITSILLDYPKRTLIAIILACGIFIFQLFLESLTDVFNSYERMSFTALVKMVAGITLTILSVIVLYFGFGLYELIGVYVFGQMIGYILALYLLSKYLINIKLRFDWSFCKHKVIDGIPFFFMTLMWYIMMRFDMIVLSKSISMAELGIYSSATLLVKKLSVIPQGVASSLLPAISNLKSKEKIDEISDITSTFFNKMIFLSLPGCIIVTVFSYDIIVLIFGKEYSSAGLLLGIGIWAFLIRCIAFLEFSVLTAFHRQDKMVKSYCIGMVYCILSMIFLTRFYGMIGAISAFVTTQLLLSILFTFYIHKVIHKIFNYIELYKILILNIILTVIVLTLKPYSIFVAIPLVCVVYLFGAVLFKLISIQDIFKLKSFFKA